MYIIIGILALLLLYFIGKTVKQWLIIKKNEFVQYIDTSGISQNPPKFIETWQGKTINFRVNKYYKISIAQMTPDLFFKYLDNIVCMYKKLETLTQTEMQRDEKTVKYSLVYNEIIRLIYQISKHTVKNKSGYKKSLYDRCNRDVSFVISVCEEMLDYWMYVKKKIQILAKGSTSRQTIGGLSYEPLLERDGTGRIFAKPRFVFSMSTHVN